MEQNNKYARGKIYTIRSPLTDKVYIGSTLNKLSKRFNDHKSGYRAYKKGKARYLAAYDIFDIDFEGTYIELYEHYSCNSRNELNRREGEVTRMIPNFINKNIAGRTRAEYHQNNKQEHNEKCRQYYLKNKQKVKKQKKQKFECPCGSTTRHNDKAKHFRTKKHKNWMYNQWQEFNHL